jgi:hypothetical protein
MQEPGPASTHVQTTTKHDDRIDSLAGFVRGLASGLADVADADQWAVRMVASEDGGRCAPRRVAPAWWLGALDLGRPAMHVLSLQLRSDCRDLGEIQLQSWKPGGFRPAEVAAARRAADAAARLLAMVVPR